MHTCDDSTVSTDPILNPECAGSTMGVYRLVRLRATGRVKLCAGEGSRSAQPLTRFLMTEQPRNDLFARREHVVDLVGLLSASFREIRASASAATYEGCDLFHDLPGLNPVGQVGGDRDDDLNLAIGCAREHD